MGITRKAIVPLVAIALVGFGCDKDKKSDQDAAEDVEEEDDAVEVIDEPEPEVEEDIEEDTGCAGPPTCLNAPPDHETFGQPCTSDLDCGSGRDCIEETVHMAYGETYVRWLAGTCTDMETGSAACDPDDDSTCPMGSRCVYLGLDSSSAEIYGCIDACKYVDTSWNVYDWNCGCREGYYCSGTSEACFPGCSNDQECCEVWNDANGDYVRQPGEVFIDDTCTNYCDGDDADEYQDAGCQALFDCINIGDADATWQSECLYDSDCPPDAYCRNIYNWTSDGEPRYPGGICVKTRCELIGRGCDGPSGEDLMGTCVNLNTEANPLYYCWATCETGYGPEDGDLNPCRHPTDGDPYTCHPLNDWRFLDTSDTKDGYCLPAMVPTATTPAGLYEDCANDGACASPLGLGLCYIRMENPGYCSARCDAGLAEDSIICGAAPSTGEVPPGVCLFGYCRPSCDTPHGDLGANGCPRATEACYPADIYSETPTFDPAGIMPTGVCMPACSTDAECNSFWSAPPYTCNTTDGTCFGP